MQEWKKNAAHLMMLIQEKWFTWTRESITAFTFTNEIKKMGHQNDSNGKHFHLFGIFFPLHLFFSLLYSYSKSSRFIHSHTIHFSILWVLFFRCIFYTVCLHIHKSIFSLVCIIWRCWLCMQCELCAAISNARLRIRLSNHMQRILQLASQWRTFMHWSKH